MKLLFGVWKETFRLLNRRPKIIIPFIIVGALNIIMAYTLYYAPQRPISYLLAAPIRRFFGEKFLHYPFNFYILPQLYSYGEIALSAFVGILMTALAVGMVADCLAGHQASLLISFIRGIKRYFALLVAWAITFVVAYFTAKYFPKLLGTPSENNLKLFSIINFFSSVIVQLLFIYLVPVMIIKNKNIFSSLKENFIVVAKLFFPTLVLGLVPALLYVPTIMLKAKTVFLIDTFFPEIIIGVVVASIVVAVIVDALVTTSTTVLFVKKVVEKE